MRSTAARYAFPLAIAIVTLFAVVAAAPTPAVAQEVDNETTTFDVALDVDGDAQISVTTRLPLADDADREGFDRLAEDHNSGADSPLDVEPFRRAAEGASEATGRPMEIRNVTRSASRTNDTGELTVSFTWTNFSGGAANRLTVGDTFQTSDGTWLPRLAGDQELVISFPPGYSPQSISMPGTQYQLVNDTVRVEGPASFEPGTPSLVLQRGETTPQPQDEFPLAGAAGFVGLLVALGLLVYLGRERLPSIGDTSENVGGGAATAGAQTGDDEETAPVAEPLLSDEERVLQLLEDRGGRMKQVEIVEATDWSNAKVSQLLSEMEEGGRIDKLRIGRENLISLPGRGPGSE